MKKIIKYSMGILCITCISAFIVSCVNSEVEELVFSDPSTYQDLTNAEVVFETNDIDSLPSKAKIIELDREVNDEELSNYLKAFNMEDAVKNRDGYDTVVYSTENGVLEVMDRGFVRYTCKNQDESGRIETKKEKMPALAEEFLRNNNLLPADFEYSGIMHEFPDKARVSVRFEKKVGDINVHGGCFITVDMRDNMIDEVWFAFSKYKSQKDVSLVSAKKAAERLKTAKNKVFIIKKDGNSVSDYKVIKKIVIRKAELIYAEYNDNPDQKHVQPCYNFEGLVYDEYGNEFDFYSYVKAVT